jgi:hypothetical protein
VDGDFSSGVCGSSGVSEALISYRAICIWDALGIAAALHSDAIVSAQCGDCRDPMRLEVTGGQLAAGEGVIHFAVPAAHLWDNISCT